MKNRFVYSLLGLFLIISCEKERSLPPSPGRMIKEFKLESGQYGNAAIYNENDVFKVLVRVTPETDLSKITPIITISNDATISPASGETIDVSATKKAIYTVTAASGESRKWEIEFREYSTSISDYDTYSIANGSSVMQIQGDLNFNEKYWDNATINVAPAQPSTGENLNRWQEWDIIYHSTVDGTKFYQLRNLHSGMFLNGIEAGSPVKQNQELMTNSDLQLWRIEEAEEAGKYKISNQANGLYLTLKGTTTSNFRVTSETGTASENQKWTITKLPKDSYRDGDVTAFFARTTGSVAFDQGTSIPLSDGRVLWVTQDAWYQGSLAPNGNLYGNHFISYTNSIIIQSSMDNWDPKSPMMSRPGASHNIGNIGPIPEGASRNWIGPGVELGDYVYIHGGEGNGLTATDQAIYKLKVHSGTEWNEVERLVIPNMSGQLNIGYAAGMVKANDGYVYAFGDRAAPGTFGYETFLHVARFPQSDPMAWTFWDGTTWASAPSSITEAVIDQGNATNNVAYLNGKYIHLTMDQGFYCGIPSINMYISTSASPTGPFNNKKLVHSFTEFYKGYNARVYTPIIHTASENGKRELLLTYSINFGACDENGDHIKESDGNYDPYFYRVKGVRVPYEMIGL